MKYINQLDYAHIPYITKTKLGGIDQEKGKATTMRSSGCGLCSAVMVADRLIPNCQFELSDALQLSYDTEANHKRGTDYKIYAPAFAEKLGLIYEGTKDPDRLLHCLRTGGAAVAHVTAREGHVGLFTKKGHYIVVINEEPDGRVAILDPSYFEGKYEEEGRQGKVEMKGIVALCDLQILAEEASEPEVSFHLFWRK